MALPTAVPEHAPRAAPCETAPAVPLAREQQRPPLGLSLLDRLHALAFVGPDVPGVLEAVRSSAQALADEDVEAARASRRRMVARLTAAEKATLDVLVGMLGEHVRGGLVDERSQRVARALDSLATNSCRRLAVLLATAERRGAAIAIENAVISVEVE